MKDRTAILCTAVLAATMMACTLYVARVIEYAADEIAGDDSDEDGDGQRTALEARADDDQVKAIALEVSQMRQGWHWEKRR